MIFMVIQLSPSYDATLSVIKRWPYMRVVSLEEDNLLVIFFMVIQLSPSYDATLSVIKRWPYKRGGLSNPNL